MPSTFTRLITVSVAAVIAAAAMAPASAATRHKRAAPAPVESSASSASADIVGLPIHPAWSPIPAAVYQAPNSCFTDEGYGRYTSCEQGGS